MADMTQIYHREAYPALTCDEREHAGKTIMVMGASSIIGQAIAASFIKTGASRIIFVGRTQNPLDKAKASITSNTKAVIAGLICNLDSPSSVDALWNHLSNAGVAVDILVLVAAHISQKPLFADISDTIRAFDVTVSGNLRLVNGFIKQNQNSDKPKAVINISSAALHFYNYPNTAAYGASKIGLAYALQSFADELDRQKCMVLNVHPGAVLGETAKAHGAEKLGIPWDNANLAGDFTAWACSPAGQILHGRFVWANWDVEEMQTGEFAERLRQDPGFLRVGLQTASEHCGEDFKVCFARITEKTSH